jgi:hypothetical protein
MPDAVHAPVHPHKGPARQACVDLPTRNPCSTQLLTRDHAMGVPRQLPDHLLYVPAFATH